MLSSRSVGFQLPRLDYHLRSSLDAVSAGVWLVGYPAVDEVDVVFLHDCCCPQSAVLWKGL